MENRMRSCRSGMARKDRLPAFASRTEPRVEVKFRLVEDYEDFMGELGWTYALDGSKRRICEATTVPFEGGTRPSRQRAL